MILHPRPLSGGPEGQVCPEVSEALEVEGATVGRTRGVRSRTAGRAESRFLVSDGPPTKNRWENGEHTLGNEEMVGHR